MLIRPARPSDDMSWTSAGLARPEAVRQWQDWAARTIAPLDVCVFDESGFAARWSSHGVGQLRLLRLEAPAQRVVHNGDGAGKATPSIQLVYARKGALKTRVGGKRFTVQPGEFVLLDNTYCAGILSADGHNWSTSAFASDYLERSFAGWPRSYPDGMDEDDKDALAYSPAGFLWDNALRHGVTLRNYGEFCQPRVRWRDPARRGSFPVFAKAGTEASMRLKADSQSAASMHWPRPVRSRATIAMTVPNAA